MPAPNVRTALLEVCTKCLQYSFFKFAKNVECWCKRNRFSIRSQMIMNKSWYTTCFRRRSSWIIELSIHAICPPMPFGWRMQLCWTTFSRIRRTEMPTTLYSVASLCDTHSKSVGLLAINSRMFANATHAVAQNTKNVSFSVHIGRNWSIFRTSVSIDPFQFRRSLIWRLTSFTPTWITWKLSLSLRRVIQPVAKPTQVMFSTTPIRQRRRCHELCRERITRQCGIWMDAESSMPQWAWTALHLKYSSPFFRKNQNKYQRKREHRPEISVQFLARMQHNDSCGSSFTTIYIPFTFIDSK